MTIYKITNMKNGKVYIGKTESSLAKRFAYHVQDLKANRHCNRHLQAAFNKYGLDAFKFEAIDQAKTKKSLSALEKNYIALYLSQDDRFGYNLTAGGDGVSGWKATDENRARMSAAKKGLLVGEKHPQFGKRMPDHVKLKLKIANEKRIRPKGKDNPRFGKKRPEHSAIMTGRKLTQEHRDKISAANKITAKGRKPSAQTIRASILQKIKAVKGINLETQEIHLFESITEAAAFMNGSKSNIAQICLGRRKTHKRWTFSYLEKVGG